MMASSHADPLADESEDENDDDKVEDSKAALTDEGPPTFDKAAVKEGRRRQRLMRNDLASAVTMSRCLEATRGHAASLTPIDSTGWASTFAGSSRDTGTLGEWSYESHHRSALQFSAPKSGKRNRRRPRDQTNGPSGGSDAQTGIPGANHTSAKQNKSKSGAPRIPARTALPLVECGAVIAAALHTTSLPYQLRGRTGKSCAQLLQCCVPGHSQLTSIDLSFPLPIWTNASKK
eukprot:Selendium_serpulae@DN11375_c0_g1_i1.p1